MPARPDATQPPPVVGPPLVIGWKEYLDLPELGISRLKAKVDTGARTSALHVAELRVIRDDGDGSGEIEFVVPLSRRRPEHTVTTRARMLRHVRVTDSSGGSEVRPVIETELVLGPVRKRILLTLTDRAGMLFRMLVGRKALEGHFLVDVSRRYALRAWHPAAERRPRAGEPATRATGGAPASDDERQPR